MNITIKQFKIFKNFTFDTFILTAFFLVFLRFYGEQDSFNLNTHTNIVVFSTIVTPLIISAILQIIIWAIKNETVRKVAYLLNAITFLGLTVIFLLYLVLFVAFSGP